MQGSNIQKWMVEGRWTQDNPNPNASYPRLQILGGNEQQFLTSTYIMRDASYLRIKNVQIGYTIPSRVIDRYDISSIRFYVGVRNLYTFDNFREGWDPEIRTGYPPVRYSNVGISINF